jgi:sphingomyelin phosphodiesterase acid-like 3
MSAIRSSSIGTLLLCALVAVAPAPAQAPGGSGQFLLISDLHFDPFYDGSLFAQLAGRPAEQWAEILEMSQPAGFNARGTDSNYALIKSSLDDARRRIPDPDFILFPGDLMAHQWQAKYDGLAARSHLVDPAAYRDFTAKAIRFLAGEFRRRYPETPVLPTLGNDDSYCGDYMIEPDGPFLAMFAEVWGPLLRSEREQQSFRETFARGGYFSLLLPGTANHRLVVLNSVFLSVNYANACGASTQTPALDQLRWLDRTLDRARAAGEVVWLLTHIPPGVNSFNSAESVQNGGPPVAFWQAELTARFLQLVGRHSAVLQAAFVGHTHRDDFRVIRQGGKPVLFLKIAPAISPIFGNNPGYQVYKFDRALGELQDYRTYYLTNLTDEGRPTPEAGGRWALEYDFRAAYGLLAVTPETVAQLADRMGTDAGMQQRYTRFYGVSAAPEFTPQSFEVYRCAIANVTTAEFLTCLSGMPRPRRPPTLPDRRRPADAVAGP